MVRAPAWLGGAATGARTRQRVRRSVNGVPRIQVIAGIARRTRCIEGFSSSQTVTECFSIDPKAVPPDNDWEELCNYQ